MSYKSDLQNNNTDLQSILDMILALGLVDVPTTISFTIDGTVYQAEEGMTWAEWVESEYNTDGYHEDGYAVLDGEPLPNCISNVLPSDIIASNGSYGLEGY